MSCACGCCPKCGCRATCTCNNNLVSLESRSDFSYIGNPMKTTVADEHDEEYSFNGDMEYSSHTDFSGADELLKGGYAKTNMGAEDGCSAGTY